MGLADPRCRSGKGCVGRTSDGPAITTNPLCAACVQSLQKQLEELPILAADLHSFMAVTPKTALQSKVNSTPEPSCPIDVRVDELIGLIEDTIDRTDGLRVADLVLQPAMKFVLWFGDHRREQFLEGWERALDIRRAHARANNILGYGPIRQRRAAPCPSCNLPTLYWYVGENTIHCSDEDCGLVLTLDEYDQHCMELVEGN